MSFSDSESLVLIEKERTKINNKESELSTTIAEQKEYDLRRTGDSLEGA
jgi:hypothetical protein